MEKDTLSVVIPTMNEEKTIGDVIEVPIRYGVRMTKPKLHTWHDGFANLFAIFTSMVNRR